MIKILTNLPILISLIFIASCGKKSPLVYPDKDKVKFNDVIDSNDLSDSDKKFKYYFDREQPKKPLKDSPATKKTSNKNSSQNKREDSDNKY